MGPVRLHQRQQLGLQDSPLGLIEGGLCHSQTFTAPAGPDRLRPLDRNGRVSERRALPKIPLEGPGPDIDRE